MKKNLSPARKRLLYALIGGSLVWYTPFTAYAAVPEETAASPRQAAQQEKPAEFTLEKIDVTASREALPPVYAGGQVARGGNIGVLGNKDFMDTPFSITSYTAQSIEDWQADTLHDVLVNDSSIRFGTSAGHVNENFIIRGLEVNNSSLYFHGMQGLAPQYRVPVEFLERVEVLKGPSSFLYGGVNTSVGGAVNLVPKRAGEEDITNFTASYAAEAHFGGHIDIGRRFGRNKEWGVRFNGLYADGDTETDGQSRERLLGSLGLDYRQERLRLSLDAFGSQENFENGLVSMYRLDKGYVKAPDGSTNAYKGTWGAARNNGLLFKSEYDLNDNLTAYAGIGKVSINATGLINGNHIFSLQSDGTALIRNVYKQYFWTDTTSSEVGMRGAYQTGSVKHQLVLGANFVNSDSSSVFNQGTGNYPTNIYNPPSLAEEFNKLAWKGKGSKTATTELSSYLLADTLSFDEEKVQLTLGIRRQNVETKNFNANTGVQTSSYDAHANTPVAGLVVKPWGESVALYANYIEMLSPGRTVNDLTYSNYGQTLAPYKSKQHEFGVKWDKGRFANTLAFFQITKPSLTVFNNVQGYDGKQKNRGIEWSAFGQVAKNLRLLGGVTYLRGELVRLATASAANEGNTPYGIPKWQMNAGVEWDTPWNPDLTLSLRAVYSGTQYLNDSNSEKLPGWVRYDFGARYKTTVNSVPVTFRASVDNLFNKQYWSGAFGDNLVTLGGPRTVKLSATMNF
ncbi:TonB-dependent siderophore receptor|uniref:Iron complex outermembrane recepter protein n=1 Tax=Dendrosporobacter quercicolus TaxID=146817 RepID=A0A1G9YAU5_9FIRM|nr:TonB-dependent siderophore receptor [Dendrosporobacter quercicolus]NSL47589.1 TonB-dependent siderophore receptor [Dendrosporobacter quercicolus DSM 1736]SDN06120.1 iron complex outermembrane recepter protein [Dendrosporobacter quercicolus]